MERLPQMGAPPKRHRTRLPAKARHGLSPRPLPPHQLPAAARIAWILGIVLKSGCAPLFTGFFSLTPPFIVVFTPFRFVLFVYKKTGLVSQGVTEKPGEFSN